MAATQRRHNPRICAQIDSWGSQLSFGEAFAQVTVTSWANIRQVRGLTVNSQTNSRARISNHANPRTYFHLPHASAPSPFEGRPRWHPTWRCLHILPRSTYGPLQTKKLSRCERTDHPYLAEGGELRPVSTGTKGSVALRANASACLAHPGRRATLEATRDQHKARRDDARQAPPQTRKPAQRHRRGPDLSCPSRTGPPSHPAPWRPHPSPSASQPASTS